MDSGREGNMGFDLNFLLFPKRPSPPKSKFFCFQH
jgi:hypothetical protein